MFHTGFIKIAAKKEERRPQFTSLTGGVIGGVLGHSAAKYMGLRSPSINHKLYRALLTASGAMAGSDVVAAARAANDERLGKYIKQHSKK